MSQAPGLSPAAAGAKMQRTPQRDPQRLQRVRRSDDPFYVDHDKKPAGMEYQWVVVTIMGQPDTRQQIPMQQNHWTPVPMRRHSEIVGDIQAKETPEAAIIVNGQMLCERPSYLNEESRAEERKFARDQVRNQHDRLFNASAGAISDGDNRTGNMSRDHGAAVPDDAGKD